MKKLFENVRKLSSSSHSSSHSNFNLRRLSLSSTNSLREIKVLRGGYNIDLQKVDSSFTKLHKAVYLNHEDRVKKYLSQININSIDNYHRSPLHFAAVNGNLRIIKLLIVAGANVNIQDCDGRSPLIKAIECGHNEVVRMLMEAGADVDLADYEKCNTALHHCLINSNLECSLYIIRNALIIDYNKRNHKKETFLHLAAKIADLNTVIEELIANGIDIEAVDEFGRTAAQVAKLHNNIEAFELITKYVNAKHQCQETTEWENGFSIPHQPTSNTNDEANFPIIYDNIELILSNNSSINNQNEANKLSRDGSLDSNFHKHYRFSGLFEDVEEEEKEKNQQNESNSIKELCSNNEDSTFENEPLYSNCEQSLPEINSNKNQSELLLSDMSELDELLNKDLNNDITIEVKSNIEYNNIICYSDENEQTPYSKLDVTDSLIEKFTDNENDNSNSDNSNIDDIQISIERSSLNDDQKKSQSENSVSNSEQSSSSTLVDDNKRNDCTITKPKSYAEVVASPRKQSPKLSRDNQSGHNHSGPVFKNIIDEKNLKMTNNGKFTKKSGSKRSKARDGNQMNSKYANSSYILLNNNNVCQKRYEESIFNSATEDKFQLSANQSKSMRTNNRRFNQNSTSNYNNSNELCLSLPTSSNVSGSDRLGEKKHKDIQANIPANDYKYINLINSLKHLLAEKYETKNSEISDEISLFKCISKVIYESKQNQIELESKNKEINSLKTNLENLKMQTKQDQKYCNELEAKLSNFDTNKNIDHNANFLLDVLKEQHQRNTKYYENILNEQLKENFALKKQCHFLKELIQIYELSNKNEQHIKNGGQNLLTSTINQFTILFDNFDEKLASFHEINKQRMKNFNEEIRLRNNFIQQFQEQILNLKLFTSQLVAWSFGFARNDCDHQKKPYIQQHIRRHSEQIKDDQISYWNKSSKLSPNRKSFSLHDLANLDNYDSFPPVYDETPNDANIDYCNSFSYKSKYFQRKINELRKQLGYVK